MSENLTLPEYSNLDREEALIADELAARVSAIMAPYQDRDGPNGFPALMASQADEILELPMSRRALAEAVAAYRRKAADQEALARVAMEALIVSESFRNNPDSRLAASILTAVDEVKTGGRPSRERDRASEALAALYPGGIPDVATISHADLHRLVAAHCESKKLTAPSRETVIRARSVGRDR